MWNCGHYHHDVAIGVFQAGHRATTTRTSGNGEALGSVTVAAMLLRPLSRKLLLGGGFLVRSKFFS